MSPKLVVDDRAALRAIGQRDLFSVLDHWATEQPATTFLSWRPEDREGYDISYAELARLVRAFAGGVRSRGVRPGDRIMLQLGNRPEYVVSWLGSVLAGAVPVGVSPAATPTEFAAFAAAAPSDYLICDAAGLRTAGDAGFAGEVLAVASDGDPPLCERSVENPFGELLVDDDAYQAVARHWREPGAVFFTSGTTSSPKGVVWSVANIRWAASVNAAHQGLRRDDRQYVCLPLHHINAWGFQVLATIWTGGSLVLVPRFSVSRFWATSVREGCTWASLIRFCIVALDERHGPAPPDHRYRLWGTGVNDPPAARSIGVRTIGWYGMSETVSQCVIGHHTLPNRPGTVGHVTAEYDLAIRDEHGRWAVPGETFEGEIHVAGTQGLNLFLEYLGQPEATVSSFEDGWFRTGDRARIDPEGAVTYLDRLKDMLKVGGENVAASEIEATLAKVREVRDCAVVGSDDQLWGEVPVAFVVRRDPEGAGSSALRADIDSACSSLSSFKRPKRVFVIDEIPRATLDKPMKRVLREWAVEGVPADRLVDEWAVDMGATAR